MDELTLNPNTTIHQLSKNRWIIKIDKYTAGKIYRLETLQEGYGYVPRKQDTWVIHVIIFTML